MTNAAETKTEQPAPREVPDLEQLVETDSIEKRLLSYASASAQHWMERYFTLRASMGDIPPEQILSHIRREEIVAQSEVRQIQHSFSMDEERKKARAADRAKKARSAKRSSKAA